MDLLADIFRQQAELGTIYEPHQRFIPEPADIAIALVHEAAELHDEFDWKWWKHGNEPNLKRAKEELIDVMHFVVAMALRLGITPDEFHALYVEKNRVNRQRVADGY